LRLSGLDPPGLAANGTPVAGPMPHSKPAQFPKWDCCFRNTPSFPKIQKNTPQTVAQIPRCFMAIRYGPDRVNSDPVTIIRPSVTINTPSVTINQERGRGRPKTGVRVI
jgi:hypothetical protein